MTAYSTPLSETAQAAQKADPDRFLCAMFAPAGAREALFALIVYNYEIARVRETVSEPAAGLIRLQWWREALIAASEGGNLPRHELLPPLAEAMKRHQLPLEPFLELTIARERDLSDAPFATMAEFISYAETTSAPFLELWNIVLGQPDKEYARKIGGAWAMVGMLRSIPFQQGAGRLMLPDDLLNRHGMFRSEVLGDRQRHLMPTAVLDISREALARVEEAKGTWPVLARLYLKQLKKTHYDVYEGRHRFPHPFAVVALLYNRLRGQC